MGRTRTGPTALAPYTLRHPDRRVQLSRKCRVGVSDGARVVDALKKAQAKARRIDFEDAIDNAFAQRNQAIADIAKLYNRKESYVRSVLCNTSQYKRVRKPTLRNAVIHQRWRDLQGEGTFFFLAGCVEGEMKTLKELREELQDEIDDGTFSFSSIETAERDRLINQLLEHRKLKRVGLRATTRAIQLDGRRTSSRMGDALMDLFERTEIHSFAMFTRGCADDPNAPHAVCSDDALDFFRESLKISYEDILRKFEQWSCNRDAGEREKNGINDVRKEVSQLVGDGLRKVTNNSSITMEWANYDVAIREGKGVEIAGFPADIVMCRPALWNVETAQRVRDGFRSGAMHWVMMTQEQRAELVASHNAQREALGAGSLKKRATRKDKGLSHKKTGPTDEAEPSEDVTPSPATLVPGVGTTTVQPPPSENPFPNVVYPQLIVLPQNEVSFMDMDPYAPPLDPTNPAHGLLTMDEITNMQLGMDDLLWLANNAASSDTPLAAAVSDALIAPIATGFMAPLPGASAFSDANDTTAAMSIASPAFTASPDTISNPHGPTAAPALTASQDTISNAQMSIVSPALTASPPPHSNVTAILSSTVSAPPNTSTHPVASSSAAAPTPPVPAPRWRKHKMPAAAADENTRLKKPRKERSDKGQPKMNPDGTFKSQKRREAAAAAA
ncbi:hypothetical protein K438DRAFT_1782801 [Mycena galopus ATCC 62051]|nr:hypothetical protein K438DRAFT_1782801 [Mycena galopus ATCC 62051]